ncbi:YwpF family protein [Bacillus sp. JJ722]|uniref:YwpF family protein n=1 Tax=Bacillus sp. JJ722 TaxID=3122973 RepID=UPI003000DFE1
MKSFKLVSLQVVTSEEELVDIELTEGLIINKEDEHNRWLLEGFINKENYDLLLQATKGQYHARIQVVITKKENSPATFDTEILTIKQVDQYYSVLFEGCIVSNQAEFAGLLLEKLIKKGLNGDHLIREFKEKILIRPSISAAKK